MDYAVQMLLILVLCVLAGNWLDQKTGYSPWFTILGVIIGMLMSIGYAYKRALLLQQKQEKERKAKDAKE